MILLDLTFIKKNLMILSVLLVNAIPETPKL